LSSDTIYRVMIIFQATTPWIAIFL